jgi:hypothetical protein
MAQVYFHCSNSQGVVIDQSGTAVRDLTEARDHAARVVQSFIMALSREDWRDWVFTSATISTMISPSCLSHPCSASRTERSPHRSRNRHSRRFADAWM